MTLELEFNSQWQTFLNIIETNVRRNIEKNGEITTAVINNILKKEIEKWSISEQYNGAWLYNFSQEFPELGQEFRQVLEELKLTQLSSFTVGFPIVYLTVTIGVMLIVFLLLNEFGQPLVRQILGTTVVAIIIFPIMNALNTEQKKKRINSLLKEIRQQLAQREEVLREIVLKADKNRLN